MAPGGPIKRTLPRFSLRLLFLAVAVLCAWLAWERSVVQRRREMLQLWASGRQVRVITGDEWAALIQSPNPPVAKPTNVSWLRRLFGDVPIQQIQFDESANAYEFERATWLFREALVLQAGPTVAVPSP